jgi:hypothetical protein
MLQITQTKRQLAIQAHQGGEIKAEGLAILRTPIPPSESKEFPSTSHCLVCISSSPMHQWGAKKSSNNRVDREVRTGKGMNTGVGGSLDRHRGGEDSSLAVRGQDEACITARVSGRRHEGARVPASGLWCHGQREIPLLLVGLGLGCIQLAYLSAHTLKIHDNRKKLDTLQIRIRCVSV